MSNITLSVDDDIIRKVRKIAIDKNTTLTRMVRNYLFSVAERDAEEKKRTLLALDESIAKFSREMGDRTWKREDLYDR